MSGQSHSSDPSPPRPVLCWPFTYMVSYVLLLILSPIERYATDEESEAQVTQLPAQLQNTYFPSTPCHSPVWYKRLLNGKHKVVWWGEGPGRVCSAWSLPLRPIALLSLSFRRKEGGAGDVHIQVLQDSSEGRRAGTHLLDSV